MKLLSIFSYLTFSIIFLTPISHNFDIREFVTFPITLHIFLHEKLKNRFINNATIALVIVATIHLYSCT